MAVPVLPPRLRDGDRLTRDEFMRRWEQMPDLKRAELIDGIVCIPSPVSNTHGDYHGYLAGWLSCYILATPGVALGVATTWLMAGLDVPQPDLALRIKQEFGGQSHLEGEYAAGAPELIVEISHTTAARDKGIKLRLYERNGVREYITIRPKRKEIIWRELSEGSYHNLTPGTDGLFRSNIFPGLWLDPAPLWEGNLSGLAAAVQQGLATPEHAAFVELHERAKR